MTRILKGFGLLGGGLFGLVLLGLAGLYAWTSWKMSRPMQGEPVVPEIHDSAAAIQHGRHIANIRGCTDCHGRNLQGRVFIDDPLAGRLVAPNLTRGRGTVTDAYSNADWVRAIRHGLPPDGRQMESRYMPWETTRHFTDTEAEAVWSYLRSLPSRQYGNR